MHIPDPVEKVKIHVKQSPGQSYPKPPSRVFIHEKTRKPWGVNHQPISNRHIDVGGGAVAEDCVE
jgi:hypothetical protein